MWKRSLQDGINKTTAGHSATMHVPGGRLNGIAEKKNGSIKLHEWETQWPRAQGWGATRKRTVRPWRLSIGENGDLLQICPNPFERSVGQFIHESACEGDGLHGSVVFFGDREAG